MLYKLNIKQPASLSYLFQPRGGNLKHWNDQSTPQGENGNWQLSKVGYLCSYFQVEIQVITNIICGKPMDLYVVKNLCKLKKIKMFVFAFFLLMMFT